MTQTTPSTGEAALSALIQRDEVLQICFWYQGEGFGDQFGASDLEMFLNAPIAQIESSLAELADQGFLERGAEGFRLTQTGRKTGGKMFAETFAEFQTGGHGECDAGCCDGDEHEHDHHAHSH